MKSKENNSKDQVQWETIEALESIANQCIYKGKEVAEARALLKALYKVDLEYNDEEICSVKPSSEEDAA